ncbi:DUF4398 domain-containing protein [bacterium]|nr:DUF4398 domain-containing protein [bacterium]
MKMRYSLLTLFVISVCGFMLTACEGPPDQLIMDAEDAIKEAAAVGADVDSPKLLDKARTSLQEAKMYNEQGNYKEARKKAELTIIRANKAQKNAERLSGVTQEGESSSTEDIVDDDE